MKKTIFFFALIFGMISLSPAQTSKESYRKYMKKPVEPIQSKVDYPKKDLKLLIETDKEVKNNLERVYIGKSPNAFSLTNSQQKPLFQSGMDSPGTQFVFEADPQTYTNVDDMGIIMSSYARYNDYWEPEIDMFESKPITNNQNYIKNPSAVLLKSPANNELKEYFTIIVGQDSINNSWSNTSFISSQLNNNSYHESIYNWESENDLASSTMTLNGDEVYIFGQDFENISGYGKNQTLKHYRGTSGSPEIGFNWEINTVNPDWLIDPVEGFSYALYTTWSAWSNDGTIGYMWMVGVTNESYENGVYQPQVYYTNNKGDTWNPIQINLENNQVLVDYLQPWIDEEGNSGTVRPSFISGDNNFPGVVDRQGRLHLFSNVFGSTTGDVLNPAESNWIDPDALGGHIFDFIINTGGLIKVVPVGEFKTRVSTNAFGNIGFNHRLQVGKTEYVSLVGAIWVDDDISGSDSLIYSDIFAWNICESTWTYGPEKLTEGDLYEGFYFFPYLAENLIYTSPLNYGLVFPISASISAGEYSNNDPSQPVTHFYVQIASMMHNGCYSGTSELDENKSHITISQNTPNPFSGETKIEITSSFQEPKEVSVEITDLLGHTVYESFEGKIEEAKEISIHAKDLKPGVYFYTISVGEESQTKKMVVE